MSARTHAAPEVGGDAGTASIGSPGTFRGRILDSATLLPLAGVEEWIYNEAGDLVAGVQSDANGIYATPALPAASYFVRTFNQQGYIDQVFGSGVCLADCSVSASVAVTVANGSAVSGIDFALDRGGSFAGTVTDATTGFPLGGTSVVILSDSGHVISRSLTRIDGTYASTGLPPGKYRARTANALGYQEALYRGTACLLANCDTRTGAAIVISDATPIGGVDFALEPGGQIAGGARDGSTGAPLQDVTIQFFTVAGAFVGTATTGASGTYVTSGLPAGNYWARTINALGYADALFQAVVCAPTCDVTGGTPIPVTVGFRTGSIDFKLLPARIEPPVDTRAATLITVAPVSASYGSTVDITATVMAGGVPLPGVVVNFSVAGAPAGTATTDAFANAKLSGISLGAIGAGVHANGIAASFSGDPGYQPGVGSADLTIARAMSVINWSKPAAIQQGTPLAPEQLNASANTAGTLTYMPPQGSVLPVGKAQRLSVAFVPADSIDYAPAAATVTIDVTDAAGAPQPTLQLLHSFAGPDGSYPMAGLITGSDGNFYGTTSQGGSNGSGAVYRMDHSGGVTALHSFHWSDGAFPAAELIENAPATFLGTTTYGTLFRMDATGNLSTLHTLSGTDGSSPQSPLVPDGKGSFYATTASGGARGVGTIYRADNSGALTVVHAFMRTDGSNPSSGLVRGVDGNFYGTTTYGGASGAGTVYRMDPAGTVTTLHAFGWRDGAYPTGRLTQGSDGNLYGTASSGGPSGAGTIYKVAFDGTTTTLHAFGWGDGASPQGPVLQATDGYFYGTTQNGGPGGAGTLYRFDADGNVITLHAFSGADGAGPMAGVTQGSDGFLYGTTYRGGAAGTGTVFRATLKPGDTPSQVVASPASGMYGSAITISARLTASGVPLAGEPIVFSFNGNAVATAITGTDGMATARGVSLAGVPGGANSIQAAFAGDAINSGAVGTADLVVTPAVPTIVWSPKTIVYGTPLGPAQLNAFVNGQGTLTYDPPPGTVLGSGAGQLLKVVFTPANSNYLAAAATTTIDVLKATPQIVWQNPLPIPAGIALGDDQLNAIANVPGTFVYSPSSGVVLPAGTNTLSATFTPFDTANVTNQTVSALLDVISPSDITGERQLSWDQPIPNGTTIDGVRFAFYLNGARSELTDVFCAPSSGSGMACTAQMPVIQPGIYTLRLAAFRVVESMLLESPPSMTLYVVVNSVNPPASVASVSSDVAPVSSDVAPVNNE